MHAAEPAPGRASAHVPGQPYTETTAHAWQLQVRPPSRTRTGRRLCPARRRPWCRFGGVEASIEAAASYRRWVGEVGVVLFRGGRQVAPLTSTI